MTDRRTATAPPDPRPARPGWPASVLADEPSPALVVDRSRVVSNLRRMIAMAGGADRLRPHAKTHKMAAIVALEASMGIVKHKCATIAEAQMIAGAGGLDVLIAFPIVGPNVARLRVLIDRVPAATFRVLVDDLGVARGLSDAMSGRVDRPLSALVDLDVGMGRTGIDPAGAADLAREVVALPGLSFDGLHAYDGHVREPDTAARRGEATRGVEVTLGLRDRLRAAGLDAPIVVLGGTPTFPIHAEVRVPGVECSPGTSVLHDGGYGSAFPDLPFDPAAFLLGRVISRPRPGRLTLDLGHKSVAADPVGPRLALLGLPDASIVGQSEEHLVVETPRAAEFPPGSIVLALPTHICPTVALHREAVVVDDGAIVDRWAVTARDRWIGI